MAPLEVMVRPVDVEQRKQCTNAQTAAAFASVSETSSRRNPVFVGGTELKHWSQSPSLSRSAVPAAHELWRDGISLGTGHCFCAG